MVAHVPKEWLPLYPIQGNRKGWKRFVCLNPASSLNSPDKLFAHVPAEWKGITPNNTPGGPQEMITLSEPGLYFFLGRSDKPLALIMQKWATAYVR